MLNTRSFFHFLLISIVVALSACTSEIETVDGQDEQGRKERYERRKKDFAKHGLYQKFHPGGQLAEEAHYLNDTLSGERKYFYPNGKTESVEHYRNGVYDGQYRKFDSTGTLILEQSFVNGAMEGWSIGYYADGTVKEKVSIKNNEEDGLFTEYHPNGKIKVEGAYGPGPDGPAEQGELKEYDESGTLIRVANCKDGACLTTWKKEE